MGVQTDVLDALKNDFAESKLLDEESKNVLIFTLYMSSFDSKTADQIDPKMREGFERLVGKNKVTEIILLVATSKSMQDFIHLSHVGH
ncbi:MAG: hypothetical protein ACYC7D_03995 [Nitrososphaerales archaeon]